MEGYIQMSVIFIASLALIALLNVKPQTQFKRSCANHRETNYTLIKSKLQDKKNAIDFGKSQEKKECQAIVNTETN